MLLLLGDQLIRDAGIAVFELAKNAYDADATFVRVTIEHPTDVARGRVRVEDDGCRQDAAKLFPRGSPIRLFHSNHSSHS